jgi:hypothetical protein
LLETVYLANKKVRRPAREYSDVYA